MNKTITTSLILGAFISNTLAQLITSSSSEETTATSRALTVSQIKIKCIQNAVEKRDSNIISAHDVFNTSIKNALISRKNSIKSSYAVTDKQARESARKDAWKKFKTSSQSAHDAMRESRKNSWKTFDTGMRACGVKSNEHGEKEYRVENPAHSY